MALNPIFGLPPDNDNLALIAEKILDKTHTEAVKNILANLDNAGHRMTDKLYASINRIVTSRHQEGVIEAVIRMEEYGMFSDLKNVRYTAMPPPNGKAGHEWNMYRLVENSPNRRSGAFHLYQLPGYPKGVIPDTTNSKHIQRVASAISWSMARNPNRKRIGRTWQMGEYIKTAIEQSEEYITQAAMEIAEIVIKKYLSDAHTKN